MRLFVGIELDEDVKAAVGRVADRLRRSLRHAGAEVDARWVDTANLHLTLWFIGEVDDERAGRIQEVLRPQFATPVFEVTVDGLGAFPRSGPPRVFWLNIARGAESVGRLYGEVRDRLLGLGFEEEKRPYSPHLTIARVKGIRRGSPRVREELSALAAACGASRVGAVTLFRSRLSPKGSQYEPLLRVPLS